MSTLISPRSSDWNNITRLFIVTRQRVQTKRGRESENYRERLTRPDTEGRECEVSHVSVSVEFRSDKY